jgi:hypothetical protein
MPRFSSRNSQYLCDGPACQVSTGSTHIVQQYWLRVYLPTAKHLTYYHRIECAIAHMSKISNGFDAAIIRAHIGEPRPAGGS